jgi:flagellar biosynthesis component FlhA
LAVVRLSPTAARQLTGLPATAAAKLAVQRLLGDLRRALRPLLERGRATVIAVGSAERLAVAEQLRVVGITPPVLAEEELVGQPAVELFTTIGSSAGSADAAGRAA